MVSLPPQRMKRLLVISSLVLIIIKLTGQVIPNDRLVDWESAIQNISIQQPEVQINVMNFGATGDGLTNDQPAVIDAISSLEGQLGYVYFPPGEYLIEDPIILTDSCILKGAGSDLSTLIFDLGGNTDNCISISKSQTNSFVAITDGFNKDNNLITVANINSFNIGDYIEIRQENGDWDVVSISWADYSVGQITRVEAIIDNKLLLESKLRIDYSPDLNPEVRQIIPISNTGIQCIKIKRVNEPEEGGGANIYTNMAANCFVRGVESDSSVGSHVSVNSSINILIDGCYFHHAFTYDGTGMRGYGVNLSHHSSECLITNNVFRYLRHAMMIKTGANGNVFSYNYSIEPHRTEQIPNASGDISFHGHYAYSNLFEGNIAQNIVIDHYWGPSGPYNTIFRNRAELYGIIMTPSDLLETTFQNFVGSEVTNTNFLHGLYVLTGEEHFEFGNNIKGEIIPAGTNDLPDSSYYLLESPYFWDDNLEWPSVGIPSQLDNGTIPAKIRYESGGIVTVCPDSIITNVPSELHKSFADIIIWPNPAKDYITIKVPQGSTDIIKLILADIYGNIVFSHNNKTHNLQSLTVPTTGFKPGIYLLTVSLSHGIVSKKVIIENQ